MKKKKDIKIVNNVIDKINLLRDSPSVANIKEARLYYDSLNDEQKEYVTNYSLLKGLEDDLNSPKDKSELVKAEAIDLQIEATSYLINDTSFDLEIKEASLNLCDMMMYNNAYIKNLIIFNEAKLELVRIKKEIENKKFAKMLDERIENIKKIDFEIQDELNEINELANEEVRIYMNHYDDLLDYLKIIENMYLAKKYDEKINSYNEISLEQEKEIFELYNEVNNLSNDIKAYMNSLKRLDEIIDELNYLNKKKIDLLLAQKIMQQIDLLNKSMLDNEISYESKMTSYELTNSLISGANSDCLRLVENIDIYYNLDDKIKALIKAHDEEMNALRVVEKINMIDVAININDIDDILKAREMYEKLNENEKKMVINYNLLVNLEEALYNEESAYLVVKEINSIKDVSLSNEKDIYEILSQYNELNECEKQLVTNYNSLLGYIKRLDYLKNQEKSIEEIIEDINNLEANNESLFKILAIKEKIKQLEEPKKIYNIKRLDEIEIEINAKNEALEFDNRANLIKNSLDYYDDILELINEYDNKSNVTKSYILQINKLKEYINILNKQKIEIKRIIDNINNIKEVEIDEGDDIARIKQDYLLLNNDLKKYITNYDLLCQKEREFMRISKLYKVEKSYLDEQIDLLIETKEYLSDTLVEEIKNKLLHDYSLLSNDEKNLIIGINKIKAL